MHADEARRFGGLSRLYGLDSSARIRAAHVCVVGLGGVGSWAAEALARTGVARLTLIDMDHIAESNVNRQVHALSSTLGQSKIEAMRDRIAQIHPGCKVDLVDDFVSPENWPALLPQQPDALIDACDQIKAKLALVLWSQHTGVPLISVGAAGGKQQPQLVELADLSKVTHDPLLAQLRYRLRKFHGAPREGKRMGVRCVFSREAVRGPDASCAVPGDGSLNCHGYGSLVGVTATFGLCAASEVVNLLAQSQQARKLTL